MNLSIKSKILFGLFIIVFLFILASYMVTLRINSIETQITAVNTLYIPLSRNINDLKSIDKARGLNGIESFTKLDFEESFLHFSRFLSKNDNIYIVKSMEILIRDYEQSLKLPTGLTSQLKGKLRQIKTDLVKYNQFSKSISSQIKDKKITLGKAIAKFLDVKFNFKRKITLFERTVDRELRTSLLVAETNGRNIILSLTLFMLIMGAISLFIFYLTSSSLNPLDELYKGVKKLSAGDYKYKITIKKPMLSRILNKILPFKQSVGEIEMLGHQFNLMSKSILDRNKELRLSERLATIGKISSEITHEIRNPLNSVGLNLALLEDEIKDNTEAKELLTSINSEIQRLSNVTQNYLNYIKPVNVAFSDESINEIIWNVYDIFKQETQNKKIDFQVNIPSQDITIPLDRDLTIRLIINLIKNAIEALEGSNEIKNKKISINLTPTNSQYVLSVVDNGPGVNKNDMDKIFLPFFSRKTQGTGLGLGISYEISKKHGSPLTCSSIPGKETTFSMTFGDNHS